MGTSHAQLAALALLLAATGCARTGLERGDTSPPPEVSVLDIALPDAPDVPDVPNVPDVPDVPDVEDVVDVPPDIEPDVPPMCPGDELVPLGCADETIDSEGQAGLCDGLDNDCDGLIDEGCACSLGDVQTCFDGPPARAETGVCRRGTQRCLAGGTWGPCQGAILPRAEACDQADNDCDGCVDEFVDCTVRGDCPEPNDPRTPDGDPFSPYPLDGSLFYNGPATSWRWTVEGGVCDQFATVPPSFTLDGANAREATLTPRLSGDYRVTMVAQTPSGPFECSWAVPVRARGLRVEMCYPESAESDIDLYMMRHATEGPWYNRVSAGPGERRYAANPNACGWHNCEAAIRGTSGRVMWGYAPSDIAECINGPQGDQWEDLGQCYNPRLDIDNNLSEGTGLPENINLDAPRDGERYRVMVQNWTGTLAHPIVNVYCAGELKATYGAPPDALTAFEWVGLVGDPGAMWRAADIQVFAGPDGETIDCDVTLPQRPSGEPGYDVTYDDPRF